MFCEDQKIFKYFYLRLIPIVTVRGEVWECELVDCKIEARGKEAERERESRQQTRFNERATPH